jgi:hypothetical protein
MKNFMKKIGEKYQTDGFGLVQIVDIFVPAITPEPIYKIKTLTDQADAYFYVDGSDLTGEPV